MGRSLSGLLRIDVGCCCRSSVVFEYDAHIANEPPRIRCCVCFPFSSSESKMLAQHDLGRLELLSPCQALANLSFLLGELSIVSGSELREICLKRFHLKQRGGLRVFLFSSLETLRGEGRQPRNPARVTLCFSKLATRVLFH